MATLVKRQPRFIRRAQVLTRARESRYSPAANLAAPGFTAALTVPSISGVMVTPQTALTFSAFYAGVHVITEDLASLPLAVFQRQKDGGTELIADHPVTYFFNRTPDGECNDFNWREAFASHVIMWGNGYAEIEWDASGYPRSLHMIHPSLILPKRDQRSGKLYYELQTADSISGPRGKRIFAPYQILHCANLGFNGLVGYSVVALQREMIGMGKAVEQFGAGFFGNGGWPGGVIEFQRSMKPEALKNFRESWNLIHQGSSASSKVALLEEGASWKSTQIPPEDAQFLMTRAFQVIEICRILRLPPHKLADYTNAHLDNIEASNTDYEKTCLRPWAIRTEKACDWRLLTDDEWRAGFYTKHDFRPLLLRTSKDAADYYQKMFQIGYYTVDEIKALEGSNPIGEAKGGNKRFVLSNLADITLAGDPAKAQQAPPAKGDPGRPERFRRGGDYIQDPETGQMMGSEPSSGGSSGESGGGGGSASPQTAESLMETITSGHDDAGFKDNPEVQSLVADAKSEVNFLVNAQAGQRAELERDLSKEVKELEKDLKSDREGKDLAKEQKQEMSDVLREQSEELKDLPDTQAEELKDLEKEHASETKELARDQAQEVKNLAKDQAGEVKDMVRDQAREAKELEKDQSDEIKNLQKEQAIEMKEVKDDPESTPETIAEFKAAHEAALASLKEDHENPTADLKAEHEQAQSDLKYDHEQAISDMRDEHEQAQAELKAEQVQAISDYREEHAQAIVDLKKEHEEAISELKQEHEDAMESLREEQANAMPELLKDHDDARQELIERQEKLLSDVVDRWHDAYAELIGKLKEGKSKHSLRFSMNGVHSDG